MSSSAFRPDRYASAVILDDGTSDLTITVPALNLWVIDSIAGFYFGDGILPIFFGVRLNGISLWQVEATFTNQVPIEPTLPLGVPAYPGETIHLFGEGGTGASQASVTVSGRSYPMRA